MCFLARLNFALAFESVEDFTGINVAADTIPVEANEIRCGQICVLRHAPSWASNLQLP